MSDKFDLCIIGAGIVGCEYATIFSNFDQTKVFLVDHQERIIPFEDEDVSRFVSQNLKKNDVDLMRFTRAVMTLPLQGAAAIEKKSGNVVNAFAFIRQSIGQPSPRFS